jgi:hypothetical protein
MRWVFRASVVAAGLLWAQGAFAHGNTYSHTEVVMTGTPGATGVDMQVRTWLQPQDAKVLASTGRLEQPLFRVTSKDTEASRGRACMLVSTTAAPYSDGYEASSHWHCEGSPVFLVLSPVFLTELGASPHTVAWALDAAGAAAETSGAQLFRREDDELVIQLRKPKPNWFALAPIATALLVAFGFLGLTARRKMRGASKA